MSLLGNILWFVFGGCLSGLGWIVSGLFCRLTIVGIPLGRQCFKFAHLSFVPFGKTAYSGAMCGGAAFLARSAAYRAGASPFTALIFSALAGAAVYIFLIRGLIGRLR